MEHVHSIMIIKKENKYLNYYDDRWKMYLFPNMKGNNIEEIKAKYKTDNVKFLFDKVHEKFSVSNNKIKLYHHYFYEVKLLNNITMSEEYKWFSMEELQKNDRIQKINSDIVEYICYNINT